MSDIVETCCPRCHADSLQIASEGAPRIVCQGCGWQLWLQTASYVATKLRELVRSRNGAKTPPEDHEHDCLEIMDELEAGTEFESGPIDVRLEVIRGDGRKVRRLLINNETYFEDEQQVYLPAITDFSS